MNVYRLLALMLASSAASNTSARDRMVDGFPELPRDAAKVAERSVACIYFYGEFSGADDERDRWIKKQFRKLRCDRVEKDLEQIRHKYRDDQNVLKILAEAD